MTEVSARNTKVEDGLWEIERQLKIKNKLELLKMAHEADIITDVEYRNSILECRKVLFGNNVDVTKRI